MTDDPEIGHGGAVARATCYRCRRPQVACICELVRPIANRTRVLIVQHPKETRHPFGTVRIARLGLQNVDVVVTERDGTAEVPADLSTIGGSAAVLYPGPQATRIAEGTTELETLVVVDGTWPTSRKLLRQNPWIQVLPRVSLAPPRPGNYRIRRAKRPEVEVSTIEAIAFALHELEPETPGTLGLLKSFDAMIDHQIGLATAEDRPRFARDLAPRNR